MSDIKKPELILPGELGHHDPGDGTHGATVLPSQTVKPKNVLAKLGEFLITVGILLIFGLLLLRDKIWENHPELESKSSIILSVLGLLLTFPISVPCIFSGFVLMKLFSKQ